MVSGLAWLVRPRSTSFEELVGHVVPFPQHPRCQSEAAARGLGKSVAKLARLLDVPMSARPGTLAIGIVSPISLPLRNPGHVKRFAENPPTAAARRPVSQRIRILPVILRASGTRSLWGRHQAFKAATGLQGSGVTIEAAAINMSALSTMLAWKIQSAASKREGFVQAWRCADEFQALTMQFERSI